jgi:hypothetical protein
MKALGIEGNIIMAKTGGKTLLDVISEVEKPKPAKLFCSWTLTEGEENDKTPKTTPRKDWNTPKNGILELTPTSRLERSQRHRRTSHVHSHVHRNLEA